MITAMCLHVCRGLNIFLLLYNTVARCMVIAIAAVTNIGLLLVYTNMMATTTATLGAQKFKFKIFTTVDNTT